MKFFLFIFVISIFLSCSDDCVSCTLNEQTQSFCDDGETQYTDMDGNSIDFEDFIAAQESLGYTCD